MLVLILGLLVFLGVHSARIFADDWRTRTVAQRGLGWWKIIYSLVSLAGFALIVWGYGLARQQPVLLWTPPVFAKHLNSLFTLAAFILIVAAYVPRNHFKARLRHPMVLGVKLWAFGHLLATAKLADALLFGAFLLWAVLSYRAARQRDRVQGTSDTVGSVAGTLATLVVGVAAWAAFAFWAHAAWIGIAPFGRTL